MNFPDCDLREPPPCSVPGVPFSLALTELGSGMSLTPAIAWKGQSYGTLSSGFQTLSLSWASAQLGIPVLYLP